MKFSQSIWAAALLLATSAVSAQSDRRTYIVQLADDPAAAYTGNVQGYAATKPSLGAKYNSGAAGVQAYVGYLNNRRTAVLSTVPAVTTLHRYSVAFNGFSAKLTAAEVATLKSNPAVIAVSLDTPRTLDTSRTPAFLNLTSPGGLHTNNIKGEGVIIGMVDGGITPEHPSFSDKVDAAGKPIPSQQAGTVVYSALPAGRFKGSCQAGPGIKASDCNNKLVGAQAFRKGFDASGLTLIPDDFASPRDADGHGTHTTATSGGNEGVAAFLNGNPAGTISGIAPRARVATYKVCWMYRNIEPRATCFGSDSVAAIDQAVADGVDVLNFSISGTRTNYLDSVEVAFLSAADAGVFVAASAGNSGPANTVAHMSPWLTTVAASTHDRLNVATITLGNGATYSGPSLQASGLTTNPLILSTEAGLAGANPTEVRLCYAAVDTLNGVAVLDPAKIAGKIVVCDRGTTPRTNKSLAVQQAGGVGMILTNNPTGSLNDDAHFVPTVHVSTAATRTAIRTYAAGGAGTASFSPGVQATGVIAPVMADFSSRGPSLANPNILKPDITAPGVNILAAYSPSNALTGAILGGAYPAPAFNAISGTSMSSPHIAGMAALLKGANPGWTPALVKSALMTTASQNVFLANGALDLDRFGYGAGHANVNAANTVGLGYDAGFPDYGAFLCGAGLLSPTSAICNAFGFLAAHNLNLPSLTSEVVGAQTIRRTVTNVGTSTSTYTGSASIPGFTTTVSPASLTLAPGARGNFTVTALRTTAPVGTWVFGNLDWTNGAQTIRSPLTLKALQLSVTSTIEDTRIRANKVITVGTGYNGTLKATTVGLVPATRTAGVVNFNSETCTAIAVPAGSNWLRVALFDSESTGQGLDDLDLEVRNAAGTVIAGSGGASTDELVNLPSPAPGSYQLCVIGYGSSRPGAVSSNYTLSHWTVAPGNGVANSLRVSTPATVATGGTASVAFMWSVTAGQRHFGTVQFNDGVTTNQIGQTSVYIDNVSVVLPAAVNSAKELAKADALAVR